MCVRVCILRPEPGRIADGSGVNRAGEWELNHAESFRVSPSREIGNRS